MDPYEVVTIDGHNDTPLSPLTPDQQQKNSSQMSLFLGNNATLESKSDLLSNGIDDTIGEKLKPRIAKRNNVEISSMDINELLMKRDLYIDDGIFFELIQDPGIDISMKVEGEKKKRINKVYRDEKSNFVFPNIYILSSMLLDLYTKNGVDIFHSLKENNVNKSMKRKNIGKWLISNRSCILRSNFTELSYPDSFKHHLKLSDNCDKVFVLSQKLILRLALSQWSDYVDPSCEYLCSLIHMMFILILSFIYSLY